MGSMPDTGNTTNMNTGDICSTTQLGKCAVATGARAPPRGCTGGEQAPMAPALTFLCIVPSASPSSKGNSQFQSFPLAPKETPESQNFTVIRNREFF